MRGRRIRARRFPISSYPTIEDILWRNVRAAMLGEVTITGALESIEADCTRLAGISEFLTVSLLARKYGLPVVPHVGDMGQIHQHLVLFNHVALGHEAIFLEHIPHLRDYFMHPASIRDGVYETPQTPGISADLKDGI